MHVYSCVAWQQISVILLDVDLIENTISLLLLPVFMFTDLLLGTALIKSVMVLFLGWGMTESLGT
jgi:hypothetical protein